MHKIDLLKTIFAAIYDPAQELGRVIEQYFHPSYSQCINGVILNRDQYLDHVYAQRQNMDITHINYVHWLENDNELFALYYPRGIGSDGQIIEAEVICYFHFQNMQIIKTQGQVRIISGNPADADM